MRSIYSKKINRKHLIKHETKLRVLIKFFLVLATFVGYLIFISNQYGGKEGFFIAIITWSFFVLCTPVAEAGFLIDFPLRLITKIKMTITEIGVWLLAIGINLYALSAHQAIYTKTKILTLFFHILSHPFPFWIIIILSAIGSFVSVIFGDELLNNASHKQRRLHKKHKYNHNFIIIIFLLIMTLILYDFLLKTLGINIPI